MKAAIVHSLGDTHHPTTTLAGTAGRYWIVSYEDQQLRFSLRSVAEEWAAALEARGVHAAVNFHDEAA